MKPRLLPVALSLAAVALVLAGLRVAAQSEKGTPATEAGKVKDEIATSEQQVARQFDDFVQSLLKLKQRLERSPKAEDRERAKVLQKVLDETQNQNVSLRLERLTAALRGGNFGNLGSINEYKKQSEDIADSLGLLLRLMREDPRLKQQQDQRKQLEKLIKELEGIIHGEKNLEAQTRIGRTDHKELEANQKRLGNQTAKLVKELDKIMGRTDAAEEAKKLKGDGKDGGKGDGKKGESKDVGKDADANAQGESKDAGKDAGKDPQAAKADAKPGDPKGADGKKGDAQAKAGGEPKDGGAKGSKGDQAKGEPKAGSPKAGADGKPGQAKSGSDSKGQAQAKSDGQAGDSPPNPGQQASSKDDGQKGNQPPQPPPPPAPKDDVAQSKKRIQDGNYEQRSAENELGKKNNDKAVEHENKAIQNLEEAKAKLEKLLRQMREEELERVLAALQARCEKMLAMQQAVLAGTLSVHKAIDANADKKPKHENKQESIRLSDQEKEIVAEATKAIEMLEAEGSAVAFPEVFQQVREDLKHVQRRLELTDVGPVTQQIETDIIDSLKEMIEALKKARQELDNKSSPPSQGGPPPDQKLLDQIAELKMIRSLQIRVNSRTTTYGRMYEGEQAVAPNVRQEIQNLSERQERIFDVTNRIARGENR